MTFIDYCLLAVLACSAIFGAVRGLLKEVISLVSWILAFYLAWKLGPSVEPHLAAALHDPGVRTWAARIPVFLAVLVLGAIVNAVVGHFVRLSIFSGLDRMLGLVFGTLRGLVIIGLAVMISQAAHLTEEGWWKRSALLPQAESLANVLRGLVGDERLQRIIPSREPSVPRRGA